MELYLSDSDGLLYVKHYGLWYRVEAICTTVQDANDLMEKNSEYSLLQVHGYLICLGNVNDKGRKWRL